MLAASDCNHDTARRNLLRAIAEDPNCKLAHYHLAMIYAARGLHADAVRRLETILEEIDATDASVWFLYGRQLQMANRQSDALDAYRETVAHDPLCEKAFLYSAQILASEGQDLARALACAQTAIAIRPPDSMIPLSVFQGVLESVIASGRTAAGFADASSLQRGRVRDNLGAAPLREILRLYPETAAVLARHRIRCAGCAGYGDEILATVAIAVDISLPELVDELILAIENASSI